jgi:hypothetical protein
MVLIQRKVLDRHDTGPSPNPASCHIEGMILLPAPTTSWLGLLTVPLAVDGTSSPAGPKATSHRLPVFNLYR